MPKPVIVIEVGSIRHDLYSKSLEFMLTSNLTASIREEYHIMMLNDTREERCYILSANEKPVYIDPPPHTIGNLKKALGFDKILNDTLYSKYGVIIPEITIKHIIANPGAAFTFKFTEGGEMYVATIDHRNK